MAFLRQEARVVERFRIIEVAEAESVTEAARRFGCSRPTIYKLIARYREGGLRALMNRPRGPREPIPEEVVELVVELKASAPHRATSKVQQLLQERYGIGLSRQSVWRILSARGLARIMDPEPLVRFERPQPIAGGAPAEPPRPTCASSWRWRSAAWSAATPPSPCGDNASPCPRSSWANTSGWACSETTSSSNTPAALSRPTRDECSGLELQICSLLRGYVTRKAKRGGNAEMAKYAAAVPSEDKTSRLRNRDGTSTGQPMCLENARADATGSPRVPSFGRHERHRRVSGDRYVQRREEAPSSYQERCGRSLDDAEG